MDFRLTPRRAFRPACTRRLAVLVMAAAGALLTAGCGSLGAAGEDLPRQDARLMLDRPAAGVHAGIHLAASRGYDRGEGVTLRLREGTTRAAVRQLESERVDAAVMDIHALARARAAGADLVGVMALVQEPLLAVLAEPGLRSPGQLAATRVAVPDDPGARAALNSTLADAGRDPGAVRTVREPDAAAALIDGDVAAAVGRWDVEGVEVADALPRVRVLRLDEHGAPGFPQLVLVVKRYTLEERANVVRALIRTMQRGYREAQVDPESAVAAMREERPELDRARLSAQLAAVAPAFTAGAPAYGALDAGVLREWAGWAERHGALEHRPNVGDAFATDLVSRPPDS